MTASIAQVKAKPAKVATAASTRKSSKKPNKYKSFIVQNEEDSANLHVELVNDRLINCVRSYSGLDSAYDDPCVLSVADLFNSVDNIKACARRYGELNTVKELVEFLEAQYDTVLKVVQRMVEDNRISFSHLKALFSPGSEVIIVGEELFAAKVVSCDYKTSMFGRYAYISYEYITSNGRSFIQRRDSTQIYGFSGLKEINKLPIRPLTPEVKNHLMERGKKYEKIAIGHHHMTYSGHMLVKKWWNWDLLRSEGRIMVDILTYSQFTNDSYHDYDEEQGNNSTTIDPDMLWMTEPYVNGFSFSTKQWGKFAIDRINDIDFKTDAFEQLVLEEDKKELIRALVTNGTTGFQDIISGKGGGCIFLLHGEPGVGKTLSAEAIAELLKRPLYSVSVGELGVDSESLEKNLRQILDVAQIWNAVILIDEADIFLEKRSIGDVVRNSLVSIFLRALEYHQGVLFLTTNRVKEFDPAFYSRISIALKYNALDNDAREKIWTNLLAAAKITGLVPAELAKVEINGRQIKNTIRLAQGLAKQQGVEVNMNHINQTLSVSKQFLLDISE